MKQAKVAIGIVFASVIFAGCTHLNATKVPTGEQMKGTWTGTSSGQENGKSSGTDVTFLIDQASGQSFSGTIKYKYKDGSVYEGNWHCNQRQGHGRLSGADFVYEGRFGASPREIRQVLYRAGQAAQNGMLGPVEIFRELDLLIKDRSVYDFLQFEPRGKYHDAPLFVRMLQDEFADIFESELLSSLTLVEEEQYEQLLQRYVENIVAEIKKEKIYNSKTSSYEPANQSLMRDLEKVIGITGNVEKHRDSVLARVAAWKIENPSSKIDISGIFPDFLRKAHEHYYEEKAKVIDSAQKAMLALGTDSEKSLADQERDLARTGFSQLEKRFGYSERAARASLKFLMTNRKGRAKT
jgi:predicted Ser/Thr protein kinase